MSTLKLIADDIAGILNEPFNDMLKERIKYSFKNTIASLLRQEINKNGIHDNYKSNFKIKIKETNIYGSINNIQLYSSVNKIPKPNDYITDDPFTYVGSDTWSNPFIYSKLEELKYSNILPMNINNPTRYMYINGYLYFYNLKGIDNIATYSIGVSGVYPINYILTEENKLNNEVFDDNTELLFPDYLINAAKELVLKLDFGLIRNVRIVKDVTTDNV